MWSLLSLIRSPVLQVAVAVIFAIASFWTYRNNVRQTAKNEIQNQVLTEKIKDKNEEIGRLNAGAAKLNKINKERDRVQRQTKENLEADDGYRRD